MSIWRRLWSEGEADLARRVDAVPEDALSRKVALGIILGTLAPRCHPAITRLKQFKK